MKNKILPVLLAMCFIVTASCTHIQSSEEFSINEQNRESSKETSAPIEEILGKISHGFAQVEVDENGNGLPFIYNGGEMSFTYSVTASGTAKNVGFYIFIDGVPQLYKISSSQTQYEYLHIIQLENDEQETYFTFSFTPNTGKKGDVLPVHVMSIYNPAFIPNMETEKSYKGFHTMLQVEHEMLYKTDTPNSTIPNPNCIVNEKVSSESVTSSFLDLVQEDYAMQVDDKVLSKYIFNKLYINDASMTNISNLHVNEDGILQITYKLIGHPGVKYKNTLFCNHNALSGTEVTSFETTLVKNEVSVIIIDIDLSKIDDYNTFYIVSVPCNACDFPNDIIPVIKTDSLLLYKPNVS